MPWHTEPTSFDSSTMYVRGEWRIRHMTKGFGISHCWLYRDGKLVGEVVSERALERVQQWAAADALSRALAAAVVDMGRVG